MYVVEKRDVRQEGIRAVRASSCALRRNAGALTPVLATSRSVATLMRDVPSREFRSVSHVRGSSVARVGQGSPR